MKKVFCSIVCAAVMSAVFIVPAMAAGSGGIPVDYPALTEGYTNGAWSFQAFAVAPAMFNLTISNLQLADQANTVFGNTLNGTTSVVKTSIVGKTSAILNHAGTYKLFPLTASSPFPSVWVKGDAINPADGAGSPEASKPSTYLTGTDVNMFYETGLTIQAPYWDLANYQWTVYAYADNDVLTGTAGAATGTVLDPRLSTMRWFSWSDDPNGTPEKQWGYKSNGSVVLFNTLPLISGATADQIKTFLIGTAGSSVPPNDAQISGKTKVQMAANTDSALCYNTDRNTVVASNANGFVITARSQVGLVYVSPADNTCHRTEKLHMQFIAIWPTGVGVTPGSKSCNIGIYQRTAN
ncbi:MAG: hypothetical protein NTZ10_05405 [Candidatus Saganbacteria bacterium]|nr:hypothetical protein [Candidatus Saganbacteria bacterium]